MGHATGNEQVRPGWSREKIKAALREIGYTLSRLDRESGMARGYFSQALVQPMPRAEAIIAEKLEVEASILWPARYGSDGQSLKGRFLPDRDASRSGTARQPSTENVS